MFGFTPQLGHSANSETFVRQVNDDFEPQFSTL